MNSKWQAWQSNLLRDDDLWWKKILGPLGKVEETFTLCAFFYSDLRLNEMSSSDSSSSYTSTADTRVAFCDENKIIQLLPLSCAHQFYLERYGIQ